MLAKDTWGISGPEFLALYSALLLVTWLAVLAARRQPAGPAEGWPPEALDLHPYEVAFLNGGELLVATAAAANLHRAGVIGLDGQTGAVRALRPPPAGTHPVERVVLDAIAERPGRPIGTIKGRVAASPAVGLLREHLRQLGLVPTPEQVARARRQALWFLPVLAVGVARLLAGIGNGRPVGFLAALLALTVVLAGWAAAGRDRITRSGRRALEHLRARNEPLKAGGPANGGLPAGDLGLAVALFGATSLWAVDAPLAGALRVAREGGRGGDGGSSADGGGGDGGGGCGGGGCGG